MSENVESQVEFDPTNPEHRFIMAVLFGELRNERTDQLTSGDLKAIYKWFKESESKP